MSQTLAPTPAAAEPKRRFTALDQFYVSCLWFAYNLMWGAIVAVVLPSQIVAIAGVEQKERLTGFFGALGGLVALVVAPVAGALSDRSRNPIGRRRPFLLFGVVLNCVFLVLCAQFGAGSNLWLYLACYLGVQFASNWWGGPYAGLIPDVVPEESVGAASGWQGLMTAVGFLLGAVVAGKLATQGQYLPAYLMIAVSLAVFMAITWFGVKERAHTREVPPFDLKAFLRSFILDPKEHRDFYWVLITRAMVTMGVFSIFGFFQYFLADIVHMSNPEDSAGTLVGIIMAAGVPGSILAGKLSDRVGRKLPVYISGGIMAVASLIYVAVSFNPSWVATLIVGVLFGLGNGAYIAVDWALAVDVLPGGEDAAKDMGIWHIAIVLPQILGPAITGLILYQFKQSGNLLLGYNFVFVMCALWFILGTVFVRQIRSVR